VFTDEYFLGCRFICGLEKSLIKFFGISILLCLGVAAGGKLVVVVEGGVGWCRPAILKVSFYLNLVQVYN
jgi:hypothetical protein